MTTIAWDGKTLAADRRMVIGCHHVSVQKIFRYGDYLLGFSGNACYIGALINWFTNGAHPDKYPVLKDGESILMMAIRRDGAVWHYADGPWPIQVDDPTTAIGSGRDYARAAMHLGQTAAEAIAVACEFDENSGNGVDTLTFDG